jgi:hypothetical protein
MTLIIAAGNSDQFIQVSDRRLTSNGVVKDDESNKAIIFNCANARLSVGFTGLAQAGTFNTRDWLLSALNECGPPDYTADKIIKRFTARASNDFCEISQLKKVPLIHKRLSIMFTGYLYHHEPPLGALAVVSNFQNLDRGTEESEALDKFECFFREERRPNNGEITLFYTLGTLPPVSKQDLSKITELVKKRKPAIAIVGKLVELIKELSDNPISRNVIGKQINSIVLPRDRTLSAESCYHSNVVKIESYMPDQILVISEKLHMNVKDISIRPLDPENTPPMSGPKLRPNQPCWCCSGKKYKKCHGRPPKKDSTWGLVLKPDE